MRIRWIHPAIFTAILIGSPAVAQNAGVDGCHDESVLGLQLFEINSGEDICGMQPRYKQDKGVTQTSAECCTGCDCFACQHDLPPHWQENLFKILRKPRYPTINWEGFLQLDTGWVTQDAANRAAVGDIEALTGLRRVRINANGRVADDASYIVDLDFAASGHPSFRDVMFDLHDRPLLQNIRLGYYQQPFGLDAMTSGRELLFLERQLPFAFDPFRQTAVGAYGTAYDRRLTWAVSGFRFPTDAYGVSLGDRGGWSLASRTTVLLADREPECFLVHAGFNYCFGDPGNDIVRYAIQPGFFVTDPDDASMNPDFPVFVDTGDILTDSFNLVGAELAMQIGPFNFQAEAKGSLVDQSIGPSLGFWGAYAQLAYVLTGETHPYDRDRGAFRRVNPRVDGDLISIYDGAWEIAVGWAHIDLNDEDIQGGRMQTLIVGVNRYLNSFTKFQVNVIRAFVDDPSFGPGNATIVGGRAQIEF